jgi:hypothetical protein
MTIRSLDLLDLPTIYRNRAEAVSLDSARSLTRGNPLSALGMMAYMNPRRHVFSAVCTDGDVALLGGVIHTNGESFARLLYLAPASRLDEPELAGILDRLASEAGTWGAMHILADLDEGSPAFGPLRRAGFSVYAGQRMWDVSDVLAGGAEQRWSRVRSVNLPGIQNLHHQIVPPLLQAVEQAPKRAVGFICNEGGSCYVSATFGLGGIVLLPLIHPDATDVAGKLRSLVSHLPGRGSRPLYVCVRTYQSWLEHVLEDLGARPGPQQSIMVKHMARLVLGEQQARAPAAAPVSVQPSRVSHIKEKNHSL